MQVLLVIALAAGLMACSAPDAAGPAWPRAAAREVDGGESLAPRAAARAIAALAEDDHGAERTADKPAAADRASSPSATTPTAARGAANPAAPSTEEPFPGEELIIEVEE